MLDNILKNNDNINYSDDEMSQTFDNPTFIVSAPRSGSTLLFELMSSAFTFHTIGNESHSIYGQFPSLRKENNQFDSGRLTEAHAQPELCHEFKSLFIKNLIDHKGVLAHKNQLLTRRNSIAFLEKTPRNSLNIPFLLKVFPKAKFIYLHRQANENISSLIEAWNFAQKTGHFVTFTDLPDWPLKHWCFLLPPGWREYKGKSIAEIASFQWRASNNVILSELNKLPRERWISINYEDLINNPQEELIKAAKFCRVTPTEVLPTLLPNRLPYSITTLTRPAKNKWRKHESELAPLMAICKETEEKIHHFINQ
jgi:hypothetical protein